MILKNAMLYAKNYVIWGDPNGDWGSFEPLKGEYLKDTNNWLIICKYKKGSFERKAKVIIDNVTSEIVSFEIMEEK